VQIYIPDRAKEGYGLNENAIRQISQSGAKLIITVDCGIANRKEVELAGALGIDVIITDHHWVPEKLPKAIAAINPKQKGDLYPCKNLAGETPEKKRKKIKTKRLLKNGCWILWQ